MAAELSTHGALNYTINVPAVDGKTESQRSLTRKTDDAVLTQAKLARI